jgi:hypothetical protein
MMNLKNFFIFFKKKKACFKAVFQAKMKKMNKSKKMIYLSIGLNIRWIFTNRK